MFLSQKSTGKMVEVLGLNDLFNPIHQDLVGRYNVGEDLQDPEKFSKKDLRFLSGEELPQCWTNVHYRDDELRK